MELKLALYSEAFIKYFYLASKVAGQILILGMTMIITVDVLARATIGKSTLISFEVSGYTLVAIVFLGLAYTLRMGRHIKIEILTRHLSDRWQLRLEIVVFIICIIFIAWFTWITWSSVATNYAQKMTSITTLHMPMWIPYFFIPVGSGMLALALVIELVGKIKGLK
ncbi:MAG: TRAP transporter small permease [Chloroflexi bacterium]|nr:TRAP transporter small permease [Chloroflexota bacterium]